MCWNLNSCLKYAPDNSWYILTMNEIFELGESLVRETVSHNLMRFLAEGELWRAVRILLLKESNNYLDLASFTCLSM